jgi:DNA-binding NarL/FixJ family response regulator
MSKNVSILQQFYINKKINNIYNTNLNDIISNIMNKLCANDRTEAAVIALRSGLVT